MDSYQPIGNKLIIRNIVDDNNNAANSILDDEHDDPQRFMCLPLTVKLFS